MLIKNGRIVDGTGTAAYLADIAIENGKIESIGTALGTNFDSVVDAADMVVCPGFIDIHSHTDITIADTHAYNNAAWENVQITKVRSPELKNFEGKRISEISAELNVDPLECVFDLLIKEQGTLPTLVFCMAEDDVEKIMEHPQTIIASDGRALATYGELHNGSPHPRYYGTFPRVLGKYVREKKILTLEAAIKKMTSMPAGVMNLHDRGVLAVDMVADITVFDPKTICDVATYENPHQYPNGIDKVIISGAVVIDNGNHTGRMMGHIIK